MAGPGINVPGSPAGFIEWQMRLLRSLPGGIDFVYC
jgi:hypothetical protein